MSNHQRPAVSVLMPAFNYARYIEQALASVLAQDYPADRIEIVVVDDGSTDDTAAVAAAVAERHPGRIKVIRKANGGSVSAVTRARAEADGDLIAMLDPDDLWLPSKTSRHVEIFEQNSAVGLVFNDMRIIDGDGLVLASTLYDGDDPGDPANFYARILRSNVVYNSSLTIRAELFGQLPQDVAVHTSWDWWLALHAALQSEVRYLPEHLALYRQHGANKFLGASGAKFLGLRHRQLMFQLWTFRHLDISSLNPNDLQFAWDGAEWFQRTAVQTLGTNFTQIIQISDEERLQAERLWEEADVAEDPLRKARICFRALAWNPYKLEAAKRLTEAVIAANRAVQPAGL